jgi:hypothetical protein
VVREFLRKIELKVLRSKKKALKKMTSQRLGTRIENQPKKQRKAARKDTRGAGVETRKGIKVVIENLARTVKTKSAAVEKVKRRNQVGKVERIEAVAIKARGEGEVVSALSARKSKTSKVINIRKMKKGK